MQSAPKIKSNDYSYGFCDDEPGANKVNSTSSKPTSGLPRFHMTFRVLIVDDSTLIRRLLSEIIRQEPGLELSGVVRVS